MSYFLFNTVLSPANMTGLLGRSLPTLKKKENHLRFSYSQFNFYSKVHYGRSSFFSVLLYLKTFTDFTNIYSRLVRLIWNNVVRALTSKPRARWFSARVTQRVDPTDGTGCLTPWRIEGANREDRHHPGDPEKSIIFSPKRPKKKRTLKGTTFTFSS